MDNSPIIQPENVYLGAGTRPVEVSLRDVQKIFSEITGKSDRLSKDYDISFKIEADDINQLNSRVKQTLEQYHVEGFNCSVTIHFTDDTQQQFASFESFALMNAASTSCVSAVSLTYNILIVPPANKIVQTFELTIRLISRVAVEKEMRESTSFVPKLLRNFFIAHTAHVAVKYVDYTVARSLTDSVDRWLTSCKNCKPNPIIHFLQRHSSAVSATIQYTVGLVVALTVLYQLPTYLSQGASALNQVAVTLTSLFVSFGLYRGAYHLSRLTGDALDSHHPISYLKLTRGDGVEIDNAEKRHSRNWIKGLIAFCAAVIEAATAKYVVAVALALYSAS